VTKHLRNYVERETEPKRRKRGKKLRRGKNKRGNKIVWADRKSDP
jgi:hypothetical protein